MNRFLSHATNRIDAKGRVSVPASFRSVLTSRGVEELYGLHDIHYPAITVGGPDLLERFEKQMASEDPFQITANDMSLVFHGGGVFLRLDKEGRLSVTDFIREHTGITDEIVFVGRGQYFQLWEPGRFQTAQNEAKARIMKRGAGDGPRGETG